MKENLSAEKIAEMVRAKPICSTDGDVSMRSAVLTFSFGPNGVYLESSEDRPPTLRTVKKDSQK